MATPSLRIVRPVSESLGLYFRPGAQDHRMIERLLAEDYSQFSGLVLDACYSKRHEELRQEAAKKEIDTVLDPRIMELALPGGRNHKLLQLPWALTRLHNTSDFENSSGIVEQLAKRVIEAGYTSILAPAHYLMDEADPWLPIDIESTIRLRQVLDANGGANIQIHYPLALPSKVFYREDAADYLIGLLSGVPVQSLWLRIHPFGSTAGPRALRNYLEACRRLHALNIPLVAEKTGVIGLSLLAFGAVGGIESGITIGERFDPSGWLKKAPDSIGFSPPPRVYIPSIGAFISKEEAGKFFDSAQTKAHFACKRADCCPKGARDMIGNPRRHFLISRIGEVRTLSNTPENFRTNYYMDEFLRPATDYALRAEHTLAKFSTLRKRLEAWRFVLSKMTPLQPGTSISKAPSRRMERGTPRQTSLRH